MSRTKFILLYVLFMVPTYFLPYLGSNSILVAIGTMGITLFWTFIHLFSMILLIIFTSKRKKQLDADYIVVFPILALIFDFTPGLSSLLFIPTVFHLITIILGVTKEKKNSHQEVS